MPKSKTPFGLWQDPPSIYRGAPFWAWNSQLDPDRLCRAVESMHRAGLGGFFMHSRYGLKTPYLGEQWFQCVEACIRKADELGMKAYLYDEDRYPSGAAGGLVTRDHKEFRMRRMVAAEPERANKDAEHVASFVVQRNADGTLAGYEPALKGARGEELSFDLETAATMGWHNEGSYIDTMNPKAVAEFIRVTHQAYADRFRKYFGRLVPAIFTDEPQYGLVLLEEGPPRKYTIQWTPALPKEFKRRRGYDVLKHLPELCVLGREEFSKVRYDYRRTLTELFVESFMKQIGAWCRRNKIELTGHVLGEEDLDRHCRVIGAPMPHYEHEGWPGIDILMDSDSELISAKQCSSVADQLGRERVLSELYGCTGWDWPLEGHKFGGDWQLACGVNFRCQHLALYSLAGGAKRDFPASIFSHSPWWNYYRAVEDYFGRLSYMLTQGSPVRDVLVVHPIESAWGIFVPHKMPPPRPLARELGPVDWVLNEPLERVIHALTEGHCDWDFGDESLLARHGSVSGRSFKVGRMSYKLVIVPATITLRSSTLRLLKKLAAAGGKVLFAGRQPDHVDAERSTKVAELAEKCSTCGDGYEAVIGAVEKLLPRRLSVTEGGRQLRCVWSMLRKVAGGRLLFIQSHDRAAAHSARVEVEGHAPAVLWDLLSGKKTLLKSREAEGKVSFDVELPPTGSALVSVGLKVPDAAAPARAFKTVERQVFSGPFDVELTEPNTLPLDYCCYRIGDEPWSDSVPSLAADAAIRARYGLGPRFHRECQPWYLYALGRVDTKQRGHGAVRRTFHVTDLPKSCKLAIEMPERFDISVNGQPVSAVDGWWVDEDIKTIDVTRELRVGDNDVTIAFNYQPDMELEDVILVGDFSVSKGHYRKPAADTKDTNVRVAGAVSLARPATKLALGSWVAQGLDFFGGAVKYRLQVRAPKKGRAIIKLPGVVCTAAAVHVNGQTFVLPWAPFEADITDALNDGLNDVVVECIGGRKNVFGPLHVPWGVWTGPSEFQPTNPEWTSDYLLVDHGLMSAVVVETVEG